MENLFKLMFQINLIDLPENNLKQSQINDNL